MIVKKKGRRWKYPAYFAASCKRETFFPEMAHIFPEKRRKPTFLQCYSYITTNQNLLHFVFSSVIMRNEQTRKTPRQPGIDTAQASRGMYTV